LLSCQAIQRIGTHANEIIVGKKYMMLEINGVNFIPLGKCMKNQYSPGYYQNDFTPSRELEFELNNNHSLLKKSLYGNYEINSKLNVVEDNKIDLQDNKIDLQDDISIMER
jgi:hypothetical protein